MSIYICPKRRNGEVKFEVNQEEERVALLEDIPASGNKGACFSNEQVSFELINNQLENGIASTASLCECFRRHLVNNGTMLAAVLDYLGCLDGGTTTLRLLSSDFKNEYEDEESEQPSQL